MSVGKHIARLLIDCEAKDGETKKAHLSVSLFVLRMVRHQESKHLINI